MFGTLVSADFDQGTLEYIENPDPAAAVSRNLRDKIHISCIFCRSRKVRCSGGRKGCERCVAMGLECVYPENRKRKQRQEKNKINRPATRRNANDVTDIVSNEAATCARDGQEISLNNLDDHMFDNNRIENSFFMPWVVDDPMQHGFDGESYSSSGSAPTSAFGLTRSESSFSAASGYATTVTTPDQLLELRATDTSLTSLLGISTTDSAGDLESWGEEPDMGNVDIAWTINAGEHETNQQDKTRTPFDSCCCLLSSISFLERLVSRSASSENRIDLLLADVRDSVETLAIFMACRRCAARVEQNMLLAMVARQISVIFEKTANCYKDMHMCGLGNTNPYQQNSELDISAIDPIEICVSTYRLNRRERLHLLKSLITLHIVEFKQQITTIKSRYRNRPNQGQVEALIEAENHVKLAHIAISSHG